MRTYIPNLLRTRNCFLALLYSSLEAARQRSLGGCGAALMAEAGNAASMAATVAVTATSDALAAPRWTELSFLVT